MGIGDEAKGGNKRVHPGVCDDWLCAERCEHPHPLLQNCAVLSTWGSTDQSLSGLLERQSLRLPAPSSPVTRMSHIQKAQAKLFEMPAPGNMQA